MEIDKPIAVFLILIVIICLVVFVILPKEREFKNVQSRAAEKKAELEAKSEYYFRLENVWEDLQRREDGLKKVDTIIPDRIDFSSLLNFLQQSAQESGVILKSVTFKGSNPIESETKMKIKMNYFAIEIVGVYPAFKNFLSALEKSARLIEVENISFSSATPKEEIDTKNIQLTIKAYSL